MFMKLTKSVSRERSSKLSTKWLQAHSRLALATIVNSHHRFASWQQPSQDWCLWPKKKFQHSQAPSICFRFKKLLANLWEKNKNKRLLQTPETRPVQKKRYQIQFFVSLQKKKENWEPKEEGGKKNWTSVLPLPRGLSTTLRFCLLLPTPIISLCFAKSDVSTLIAKLLNAKSTQSSLARPPSLCNNAIVLSPLSRVRREASGQRKSFQELRCLLNFQVSFTFFFLSMFHSLGCVFFFHPCFTWMCLFFSIHIWLGCVFCSCPSMFTRVFYFLVSTKFCSFIIEFRVIEFAFQSLHFQILKKETQTQYISNYNK